MMKSTVSTISSFREGAGNGSYRRVVDLDFISLAEFKRAVTLTHSLKEYDVATLYC